MRRILFTVVTSLFTVAPALLATTLSLSLVATPAHSQPAPPAYGPTLSAAAETAWLAEVVAHSPHRQALAAAALLHPAEAVTMDLNAPSNLSWLFAVQPKAWPAKKGRRLLGYLPYWTMKSAKLHWQQLTQLAYFAAQLDSKGNFIKLNGWGGSSAKKLILLAHQNDVQVPLTVTLFSKTGIHSVLATTAKRTALVKKIITLVLKGGGDGVNIDFEGMAKADRGNMNAFIKELNVQMKKQLPGADVTLATPAVDWSKAWDYQFLAENSDGLMVMAYGLHWSGGPPGPNLPLGKTGGVWQHKTLQWVVDNYVTHAKEKNVKKIIIGLPLYGHVWPSSSAKPGAKSLGKAKSVTYEKGLVEAPTKGGWKWDVQSKSSYYVYKSAGKWMQTWTDTAAAFDLRVKYVDARGTQMGLWALGYADTSAPVWKSLAWYVKRGAPVGPGPDASGGDAGGGDAGGGDAGGLQPGPDVATGQLDGAKHDATKPDATKADTAKPDATKADATKADTAKADTTKADTVKTDGGTSAADTAVALLDSVAVDAEPTVGSTLVASPDSGCSAAANRSVQPTSSGTIPTFFGLLLLAGMLLLRRKSGLLAH